jgi:hypothetical protein
MPEFLPPNDVMHGNRRCGGGDRPDLNLTRNDSASGLTEQRGSTLERILQKGPTDRYGNERLKMRYKLLDDNFPSMRYQKKKLQMDIYITADRVIPKTSDERWSRQVERSIFLCDVY